MTTTTVKESIGKALGRVSSGLYIMTAGQGQDKHGILASWVMQASFEPPMVTVCIQQDRPMLKTLETTGAFILNVLGRENNDLMGRFSRHRDDACEGIPCRQTESGFILETSVAYLTCRYQQQWVAGDHVIVLAEVIDGGLLNAETQELWLHTRKNGFSY